MIKKTNIILFLLLIINTYSSNTLKAILISLTVPNAIAQKTIHEEILIDTNRSHSVYLCPSSSGQEAKYVEFSEGYGACNGAIRYTADHSISGESIAVPSNNVYSDDMCSDDNKSNIMRLVEQKGWISNKNNCTQKTIPKHDEYFILIPDGTGATSELSASGKSMKEISENCPCAFVFMSQIFPGLSIYSTHKRQQSIVGGSAIAGMDMGMKALSSSMGIFKLQYPGAEKFIMGVATTSLLPMRKDAKLKAWKHLFKSHLSHWLPHDDFLNLLSKFSSYLRDHNMDDVTTHLPLSADHYIKHLLNDANSFFSNKESYANRKFTSETFVFGADLSNTATSLANVDVLEHSLFSSESRDEKRSIDKETKIANDFKKIDDVCLDVARSVSEFGILDPKIEGVAVATTKVLVFSQDANGAVGEFYDNYLKDDLAAQKKSYYALENTCPNKTKCLTGSSIEAGGNISCDSPASNVLGSPSCSGAIFGKTCILLMARSMSSSDVYIEDTQKIIANDIIQEALTKSVLDRLIEESHKRLVVRRMSNDLPTSKAMLDDVSRNLCSRRVALNLSKYLGDNTSGIAKDLHEVSKQCEELFEKHDKDGSEYKIFLAASIKIAKLIKK